jgi:hypothetical protein
VAQATEIYFLVGLEAGSVGVAGLLSLEASLPFADVHLLTLTPHEVFLVYTAKVSVCTNILPSCEDATTPGLRFIPAASFFKNFLLLCWVRIHCGI